MIKNILLLTLALVIMLAPIFSAEAQDALVDTAEAQDALVDTAEAQDALVDTPPLADLKERRTPIRMAGSEKVRLEWVDQNGTVHKTIEEIAGEKMMEIDHKYDAKGDLRWQTTTRFATDGTGTKLEQTTTEWNAAGEETAQVTDYPEGKAREVRYGYRRNPREERTYYDTDKTQIRSDTRYDDRYRGRRIERTEYNEDGTTRSYTTYHTGGNTPKTHIDYHPDGSATRTDYDPVTGEPINSTTYPSGHSPEVGVGPTPGGVLVAWGTTPPPDVTGMLVGFSAEPSTEEGDDYPSAGTVPPMDQGPAASIPGIATSGGAAILPPAAAVSTPDATTAVATAPPTPGAPSTSLTPMGGNLPTHLPPATPVAPPPPTAAPTGAPLAGSAISAVTPQVGPAGPVAAPPPVATSLVPAHLQQVMQDAIDESRGYIANFVGVALNSSKRDLTFAEAEAARLWGNLQGAKARNRPLDEIRQLDAEHTAEINRIAELKGQINKLNGNIRAEERLISTLEAALRGEKYEMAGFRNIYAFEQRSLLHILWREYNLFAMQFLPRQRERQRAAASFSSFDTVQQGLGAVGSDQDTQPDVRAMTSMPPVSQADDEE